LRKKGNISDTRLTTQGDGRARESMTDWARVDAKTEEELAADMASDPAWDGVPEDWVSRRP